MIHESIAVKILDKYEDGSFYTSSVPIIEWREWWPIVIEECGAKPDEAIFDVLRAGIAEQSKISAHIESIEAQNADHEFGKRQAGHLEKIRKNKISHETPFDQSPDSIRHEFNQTREALDILVKEKAQALNRIAKTVIEALASTISTAREIMQKEELSKAKKWGVPFVASESLKLLASAEQQLIYNYAGATGTNPTIGYIREAIPPLWADKLSQ